SALRTLKQEKKIPFEEQLRILNDSIKSLQNIIREESKGGTSEGWGAANLEILNEFIATANDSLATTDEELLKIQENPHQQEAIQSIFRTFHSIKGVAGFLKLDRIIELSGQTEGVLERVREGKKILVGEVLDVIFDAVDLMKRLVAGITKS